MGGCKLNCGMRHAQLELTTSKLVSCQCRIHSRESVAFINKLSVIDNDRKLFFPLVFSRDNFVMLPLVNVGEVEASIRARFYCGTRSPEAVWNVGPHQTKLVDLKTEFAEYIDPKEDARVQAYIRLSARGDFKAGAMVVYCWRGMNQSNCFTVVE